MTILAQNNENLIDVDKNKILSDFFHKKLWSEEASYVREYIYSRGLSDQTIKDFQLGWCPSDWNGETKWWNHRLMVPLIDSHGDHISFHTRIITKKIKDNFNNIYIVEEKTNKIVKELFVNGEKREYNTVWFHGKFEKSCFLYGMDVTKEYIKKENYAIIVEGIFDALILYEHGVKNVVATLGSALTDHQICLLKRYCDKLVFMFDADEGGYGALKRAKKKCFFESKTLILPDNYDPHDFVLKYGIEPIKKGLSEI